jgi:mannose-6-phosphate isomerase-like protein (cupin superfamily)
VIVRGRFGRLRAGYASVVLVPDMESVEFEEAWIESDEGARWRSASLHGSGVGASASGSSILEVEPGRRVAPHTDSAEETIVVLAGRASVRIRDEEAVVGPGGIAVVPEKAPHEVANAGEEPLRFLALYAAGDVMSTYEEDVQPDGGRSRSSTA